MPTLCEIEASYTPEEKALREVVTSLGGRWYYYIDDAQRWEKLKAAALDYARPTVAEECVALIRKTADDYRRKTGVELLGPVVMKMLMTAIREHGKVAPSASCDVYNGTRVLFYTYCIQCNVQRPVVSRGKDRVCGVCGAVYDDHP